MATTEYLDLKLLAQAIVKDEPKISIDELLEKEKKQDRLFDLLKGCFEKEVKQ